MSNRGVRSVPANSTSFDPATETCEADLTVEERNQIILRNLSYGFFELARDEIARYGGATVFPDAARILERIDKGEEILAGADVKARSIDPQEPASGVLVAPCLEGSNRALLICPGLRGEKFALRRAFFDLQGVHLIFIRDVGARFLICDIPRLSKDYAETQVKLGRILENLGCAHLYCLGFSAGAYASLRLGLDLGAEGVLNFSGPTSLDLADREGATLKEFPQIRHIVSLPSDLRIGMAHVYRTNPVRPQVRLVFGENHERDSMLARLMEGIPGVDLRPMQGYDGHSTFPEAVRRGELAGHLTDLMTFRRITADLSDQPLRA